jgi:hypothetical protein
VSRASHFPRDKSRVMELIVLDTGLDLGIVSPTLFAMMVLMALAAIAPAVR